MFDFTTPYTDMFIAEAKKSLSKLISRPTILHRMTCPCCGKKLVNLYYSATQDKYFCKDCLDKVLNRSDNNAE